MEDSIDSSEDAGKLMISVLSAVAEIERENILVQTMEGRKQKAREGKIHKLSDKKVERYLLFLMPKIKLRKKTRLLLWLLRVNTKGQKQFVSTGELIKEYGAKIIYRNSFTGKKNDQTRIGISC